MLKSRDKVGISYRFIKELAKHTITKTKSGCMYLQLSPCLKDCEAPHSQNDAECFAKAP
jgi:hypothetical protein